MTTTSNPQHKEKLIELKTLLQKETETYQQMAKTMMDKKTLLIQGQYKQLGTVDQKLATLGQQSTQIETRRMNLMTEIGHQDQTLQQLIEELPGEDAQEFIPLRQKLLHVVKDVQYINNNNQRLLEMSIKWIENTVETIAKAVTPQATTYNAKGQQGQKKNNAILPIQSTVVKDI